jgi:hypothetical protein
MLHYVGLWLRFVMIAIVQEAKYRVNFAVNVLVSSVSLGLAILTFLLRLRSARPRRGAAAGTHRLRDAPRRVEPRHRAGERPTER